MGKDADQIIKDVYDSTLNALRITGGIETDYLIIPNAKTPATAGAAGTPGMICWDASYIYVCIAANSWKRAAIAAGW